MQQFFWNRPSPFVGTRGPRRIAPKWQFGLSYCLDLTGAIPNINVGAPGKTYTEYSVNNASVQASFTNSWQYGPDAYGNAPAQQDSASGDKSIGPSVLTPVTPTTAFSLSVWYRPFIIGDFALALGRGTSSHCYGLSVATAGVGYNVDRAAGGTLNTLVASLAVANVWNHYGMTWDGVNVLCYVNGSLLTSFAAGGGFGNGNAGLWQSPGGFVDIGSSQRGASKFPMIWTDRLLTPYDMWDLYANPSPFQEGILDADINNPPAGGGGGGIPPTGFGGITPILGIGPAIRGALIQVQNYPVFGT